MTTSWNKVSDAKTCVAVIEPRVKSQVSIRRYKPVYPKPLLLAVRLARQLLPQYRKQFMAVPVADF